MRKIEEGFDADASRPVSPEAGGGDERTAAWRGRLTLRRRGSPDPGPKPREKAIGVEYNLEETACSSARGRTRGRGAGHDGISRHEHLLARN
jgi:hypothetical protein